MMHLLKELAKLSENSITDARYQNFVEKLEEKEKALLEMIEEMKRDIETGEFDSARLRARKFEDLCHSTNELANRIAALDK